MAKIYDFKNQWLPGVRTPETPQLLPRSMLESRLEANNMSLTINTRQANGPLEQPSRDEDARDSPRTLVTSDNSGASPIQEHITVKSFTKDVKEVIDEDHISLLEDKSSPLDPRAPYPTPLHIIEALCGSPRARDDVTEKSHSTWHLSNWDDNGSKGSQVGSDETLPQDSTVEKGIVVPYSKPPLGRDTNSFGIWRAHLKTAPIVVLPSGAEIGHRDIDPETGHLLDPIKHPETHMDHCGGQCKDEKDLAWRQANMTSTLHIKRCQELKRRQEVERQQVQVWEQLTPTPEEVVWPKANCLIRPAAPRDFGAIAAIMNLEIQQEKRPRIVQAEPATLQDVEFAYHYCQQNLRPFLVAIPVGTDLVDRSKWPQDADEEYEEYMKFKRTQPEKKPPSVLGFAFVTETRVGVLGSHCSGSRFSGQIKLAVHPAHRRKSYGSALLDRILLCTAIYHRSLVDHQWECPEPAAIYEDLPIRNQRKYTHLYIDTLFEGAEDSDIKWITNMLEKFEFKRIACFKNSMRLDRGENSTWMDLVTWELEARPVAEIADDTPPPAILAH